MWIITNGAPKTGSTWITQLVHATGRVSRVPERYQNSSWQNASVRDELVEAAANELAPAEEIYLSKQHWAGKNKNLLAFEGIRIANSIRDIRDTIVSRYHHDVRLSSINLSVTEYLDQRASKLVRQFCGYQRYWIEAAVDHPNAYHISSYEQFSKDGMSAARDLFAFCGFQLSAEEVARAVESTKFEKKDTGPGKFFRKGKVHAFGDDLSDEDAALIMDWAGKFELREIKNRIARFNPALEPYLAMTDVGL